MIWTFYGPVTALVIDPFNPSILHAGVGRTGDPGEDPTPVGAFRSSDGGATWQQGLGLGNNVFSLAIDPSDTSIVYAGTGIVYAGTSGVWKSIDGGGSWETTGLTYSHVYGLIVDPSNNSIIYAGTDEGVFKSITGGGSWSVSLIYTPVYALAIDPSNSNIVYAGSDGYYGALFKSTDGARTWNTINSGLTDIRNASVFSLAVDPSNPGTIYAGGIDQAGTYGVVYKSTNSGGSWSGMSNGLPNSQVSALVIDPGNPDTLYAGTPNGVFKFVTYMLTTSVNPSGAGALRPPSGYYNGGQGLSVSAVPTPGYTFSGWSGDLSGVVNPTTITMDGPKAITANFTGCGNLPVQIGSGFYSDIQSAYNAAVSGDLIESQGVEFIGDLLVDRNIGVTCRVGMIVDFQQLPES